MSEQSMKIRAPKRARHVADSELDDFMTRVEKAIELIDGVEVYIPGPTPANAGQTFLVPHALGERPDNVAMIDAGDTGGRIYANGTDKTEWTATHVLVRCDKRSETNLTIRLTKLPEAAAAGRNLTQPPSALDSPDNTPDPTVPADVVELAAQAFLMALASSMVPNGRVLQASAPLQLSTGPPGGTSILSLPLSTALPLGLGTAAAGATNEVSDAGHIHPKGLFVEGPADGTSVADHVATFLNPDGDIKDSGILITDLALAPVGATVVDNLASFVDTDGNLKDSGILSSRVAMSPATTVIDSIPTYGDTFGNLQDSQNWLISGGMLVPAVNDTFDIGVKGGLVPHNIYCSRFLEGKWGFFGPGSSGYTGAYVGQVLTLAGSQVAGGGPGVSMLYVVSELDANSEGNTHYNTFYEAIIDPVWEPDGTGNNLFMGINLVTMSLRGGRSSPVWDGTLFGVNLFNGSISIAAPETIASLDGMRFDTLQTTGTPATQSACFNLGTGNATKHYGIMSNGDFRLRGVREMWFGPLLETATPLNSIRAKAAGATNVTLMMKLNATDVFQFENGAVNNGARLWMRDESNATARYVKMRFLSTGALAADRNLRIDMLDADQTLIPAYLGQDLRSTASPAFGSLTLSGNFDLPGVITMHTGAGTGWLEMKERGAPATPGANIGRIFMDTVNGNLKIVKDSGSVIDLEDRWGQDLSSAGTPTFGRLTLTDGSNHLQLNTSGGGAVKILGAAAETLVRSITFGHGGTSRVVTLGGDLTTGGNLLFNAALTLPVASAYTPTNVVTDRAFDADNAAGAISAIPTQAEVENIRDAVLEIADVLGTLIADFQAAGALT